MDKAKSGQNDQGDENLHCGACRSLIVDSAGVDLERLQLLTAQAPFIGIQSPTLQTFVDRASCSAHHKP